ncbi:hypothetical protein C8R47DRAFT_1314670, partial [Mycena vitilis]
VAVVLLASPPSSSLRRPRRCCSPSKNPPQDQYLVPPFTVLAVAVHARRHHRSAVLASHRPRRRRRLPPSSPSSLAVASRRPPQVLVFKTSVGDCSRSQAASRFKTSRHLKVNILNSLNASILQVPRYVYSCFSFILPIFSSFYLARFPSSFSTLSVVLGLIVRCFAFVARRLCARQVSRPQWETA